MQQAIKTDSRGESDKEQDKNTHKKKHVKISFRNFENPMKQYRTCLDLHEAGNVIIEPKYTKLIQETTTLLKVPICTFFLY